MQDFLASNRVVSVKEIIAVAGVEMTANSDVVLPDEWRWPRFDADVVTEFRRAGALIGLSTTSHEFAWGITTSQADRRRSVNPFDPSRVAGGSSGGAAVSVADGDAWLAVGTDTGGSVRIPAAWCGVYGWKPSASMVSTRGVLPLAPSLDTVGFLASEIAALCGVAPIWGVDVNAVPRQLRVGMLEVGVPTDAATRQAVSAVHAALLMMGHVGADAIRLSIAEEILSCYTGIQLREALLVHQYLLGTWPSQSDRYGVDVRERLGIAERLTGKQEIEARSRRAHLCERFQFFFEHLDVMVLATAGCPPPFVLEPDVVEVDDRTLLTREVVMPHTALANLIGCPAVTLPWGRHSLHGTPLAVQVIAAPGRDAYVLASARALAQCAPKE